MARLTIGCLLVLFTVTTVWAQQDSMVYQYWKRDPNMDVSTTVSNQKQIITKEQILFSGYTLLSDVLQLIDAWTMSTWNGDRWNMVSNGAGNYQQQNWTLLLDGVKMELIRFDALNINTLGISVYDIERIEVVNAVGNYLGEFNDRGIIHIVTKRNNPGFSYRAFVSNGNESGDPHLNAINNLNLNVHEYGTVVSNAIGYKGKKWNIQASQYANNYFYRDTTPFIYPLVSQYNAKPDMFNSMINGRLLATYSSLKSTHQLTLHANQADDVILPAGIFKPITGKYNYFQAGYIWRRVVKNGVIQYRGSFTNRSFKGDLHRSIDHEQQYHSHQINHTANQTTAKGAIVKQMGMELIYANTLVNTNSNTIDYLIRPYYSYTYPLTRKSTIFTDVSLATNFNHFLPSIAIGYYKQPSILTNWSFVGSLSQRNQFQNNSYTYLLSIKDTNGLDLTDQLSSLATIDYFFNLNASKYFKISFNSGIKQLSNEFQFKPTVNQGSPPFLQNMETTFAEQTCWINRLNVYYDMFRGTQLNINYLRTNFINTPQEQRRFIPEHKFSVVLSQSLPSRFYFWARYYYQSETAFINSYGINNAPSLATASLYATLKSLHTFDVGVSKKLFKNFLITNLSVRNVLNTTERYQANGAAFNLRLFLSVRINI